jgi:aspartate/methionine/tyrosine aminotransferase
MITRDRLNPHLLAAEYAVRGPVAIRAQQLEEQGRRIVYCNIGNPQALKQKPLTYLRQVLSLLEYPALLGQADARLAYPADVLARAESILSRHPHGVGAYSQSAGIPFIRQAVAEFIQRRDGIPAARESVILTDGASKGVQAAILSLIRGPDDGFMIPIPQYPLYSATIALFGGRQIGYYLDEANRWQLGESILEESIARARAAGIRPVAIAVINPGNPTGAVLSEDNVRMIVRFAKRNALAILADEVYQENVYAIGARFHSFAKVMAEMDEREVTLYSFHSVSKGFLGECGHRGGYVEFRNMPPDVLAEMVKLQSIGLCANLPGQIATYLMVAPPQPGDESYETYCRERDAVLSGLARKAEILGEGIRRIEGMQVEIPRGAMYAFVRFELPTDPTRGVAGMSPAERLAYDAARDTEYCMALLDETGICVVPGSGFGQWPGTLHFRTTFLPPEAEIRTLTASLKAFHESYVRRLEQRFDAAHAGRGGATEPV